MTCCRGNRDRRGRAAAETQRDRIVAAAVRHGGADGIGCRRRNVGVKRIGAVGAARCGDQDRSSSGAVGRRSGSDRGSANDGDTGCSGAADRYPRSTGEIGTGQRHEGAACRGASIRGNGAHSRRRNVGVKRIGVVSAARCGDQYRSGSGTACRRNGSDRSSANDGDTGCSIAAEAYPRSTGEIGTGQRHSGAAYRGARTRENGVQGRHRWHNRQGIIAVRTAEAVRIRGGQGKRRRAIASRRTRKNAR